MKKLNHFNLFLILLLALGSCTSTNKRNPSSSASSGLDAWKTSIEEYTSLLHDGSFSPDDCLSIFTSINQKVQSLDFNSYSNEELKREAVNLIERLWQLRLQLHNHLDQVSPQCRLMVREIFHHVHDQEDYFGEFAYNLQALDPSKLIFQNEAVPIYDRGAYPPYGVRPDLDDPKFQFLSGDLMLARGISFFSAIISKLSDNKSQFSHVVFVNKDAKTKKLNTVESYIGSGVDRYEMDVALKNENVRLLVLRPKDRKLGERAANYAMASAQVRLPYDFYMNFSDYSKMSCVEVARASYDKASNGSVLTPDLPAKLNINNPKFLEQVNLKNGDLITPDDLEVDPRFELVLDWRDYRLIRDSRYKDAILSEMIDWIGNRGYKFHETIKSLVAKNIILPSRSTFLWPLVKKITGSPDLNSDFPNKTLGMTIVLNKIGEALLERVNEKDAAHIAKHNRPMTNGELRNFINDLRLKDLKNYRYGNPSFMHSVFRADEASVKGR